VETEGIQQLELGNTSVRLDNRFGVGEPFLGKIVQAINLPKCRLLLILDTENGFTSKRGISFAMSDMNYAAPINGVNNAYDRKRIGKNNITAWREWDYAVYIPKITAEKWKNFEAYFALVLGHELEHVRIMVKNIEFHRCVSWLFDDNFTIFKEAGFDCKSKKTWQFPLELNCNNQGKMIAEDIFGKEALVDCLTRLIPHETDEHQEYLDFILKLKVETQMDDICQHILNGVQKYYLDLEKTVHKVWGMRKSLKYEFASQFDLRKFIPLNCVEV